VPARAVPSAVPKSAVRSRPAGRREINHKLGGGGARIALGDGGIGDREGGLGIVVAEGDQGVVAAAVGAHDVT